MIVYPALSIKTGHSPIQAMEEILKIKNDGKYEICHQKCQITPQNYELWDEKTVRKFKNKFKNTDFRFHASVRLNNLNKEHCKYPWYDLSRFIQDKKGGREYFKELSKLNKILGNNPYTFHTGYKPRMLKSNKIVIKAYHEIKDIMECDIGIETLYPYKGEYDKHWFDCWDDHRWLLDNDINYVIDLSHINIIANYEGIDCILLKNLLRCDRMIECHISGNNGVSDSHLSLSSCHNVWWERYLPYCHQDTVIFTEGLIT